MPPARRTSFAVAMALLVYAALEASSWLTLRIQQSRGIVFAPIGATLSTLTRRRIEEVVAGGGDYIVPSAELGWTIKRGGRSSQYCANDQGLRGDHNYPPVVAPGRLRIAAFGDSFTHGDEVENHQTWEEQIERRAGHLEVVNFGVPGFGIDQSLLRFRHEAPAYSPRIAIMGLIGVDVSRHVNTFRPFLQEDTLVFAKPRFTLEEGRLVLVPNPMPSAGAYQRLLDDPGRVLPALGRLDGGWNLRAHVGPFDPLPSVRVAKLALETWRRRRAQAGGLAAGGPLASPEALAVTQALLESFCREARGAGARPLILFFPTAADLAAPAPSYAPLRDALGESGATLLDLLPALRARGAVVNLFRPQGHYGPEANGIVAHALLDLLSRSGEPDAMR